MSPSQRCDGGHGAVRVETHRVEKLERFVEGAFCVRSFALPTACRPCRRQPILRWTGIIGVGALPGKAERTCSARAWLSPLILTCGARQWHRPGDWHAPSGAPRRDE